VLVDAWKTIMIDVLRRMQVDDKCLVDRGKLDCLFEWEVVIELIRQDRGLI
jgi:hypothetical protein